jgi:hypothetical protein
MARRHLTTPGMEGQVCPAPLLDRLQEIDPSVDMIYVGEGVWWLGAMRPNDQRREAGQLILGNEERRAVPNSRNVILGRCLLEGFARIEAYRCPFGPDGTPVYDSNENLVPSIVEDLRERTWRLHADKEERERVFLERAAHTDKSHERAESRALMHDYMLNDGRDHYNRQVKHRLTTGWTGDKPRDGYIILP